MSRRGTGFVCQDCGQVAARWMGRCPACGNWNTMVEAAPPAAVAPERNPPVPLTEVPTADAPRLPTGSPELDRVLGGGIMPASLTLIGGDPGVGKSTLVLQCGLAVASAVGPVLYVSGEESTRQLRLRADRLGTLRPDLYVVAETDIATVEQHVARLRPALLVVDSIQTTHTGDVQSVPGSIAQIRAGAAQLLRIAKSSGVAVFIVGHVTKEGALAGPRVLEHIVDTVLYFEGDLRGQFRVLRAVKNRFGSTNEIGLFEMRDAGLADVPDASSIFLAERPTAASGSVVVPTVEGTRPLLIEVQALVSRSGFVPARRAADGVDQRRVHLLLAVLEKRVGLSLGSCDVYVRVAGGLSVGEPAADLGLIAALASSYRDRPADAASVVMGEVGMAGEVRAVSRVDQRLREAEKMGFRRAVLPAGNLKGLTARGSMELVGVRSVVDALAAVLQTRTAADPGPRQER